MNGSNGEATLRKLPLDEIEGRPENPKDHDIGALVESLRRFGFVSPAIRDEASGRLVVGHGRVEALRVMRDNGEEPPRGAEGWEVPVVCGIEFASEQEAMAYLVADNRLTELGGWNLAELPERLVEIVRETEEGLAGIGYDGDDIEAMIKQAEIASEPGEGGGGTEDGAWAWVTVECKTEDADSVRETIAAAIEGLDDVRIV